MAKSPYESKLSNAKLFLDALTDRAQQLPSLIHANLGNQLAGAGKPPRQPATGADQAAEPPDRIVALPLGSRVRLDPWSNEIQLMKAIPVPLISQRDKLPFEVTPFTIYLSRNRAQSHTGDPDLSAPVESPPARKD